MSDTLRMALALTLIVAGVVLAAWRPKPRVTWVIKSVGEARYYPSDKVHDDPETKSSPTVK